MGEAADNAPEAPVSGVTIEIAEPYGFCAGVRRAVATAEEAAREHGVVRTLGPLMHNPQEVERLVQAGVVPLEDGEDPGGKVVLIRSHGTTVEAIGELERRGACVIDTTCPLVKKVQELSADIAAKGHQVLLLGDMDHSEVKGILSRAPQATVVEKPGDLKDLKLTGKVGIVAQTTQSQERLSELVKEVVRRGVGEIAVFNTICSATADRQRAAAGLAGRVDCTFVLGGKRSANTRRLAEQCKARNSRTYHLETHEELTGEMVRGVRRMGVAAGASTPDWIVREFIEELGRLTAGRRDA